MAGKKKTSKKPGAAKKPRESKAKNPYEFGKMTRVSIRSLSVYAKEE